MAGKRRRECSPDPLEKLIADGKIRTLPYSNYRCTTTLTIDFDLLATKIQTILSRVYLCYDSLYNLYTGKLEDVNQSIMTGVVSLTNFALCILYNRLRAVAKSYSSSAALARMTRRAPVNNEMEFPSFLSSLISSIGFLEVTDAGRDALVLYAPPPNTDNNYGRSQAPDLEYLQYERLISNLRFFEIGLSPVDFGNHQGAFWTTCSLHSKQSPGFLSVAGTVHLSNYTNDDIVRSLAILDPDPCKNPFENVAMTIGFTSNVDVVDAIAANPPVNTLTETTAVSDSGARHVGIIYHVDSSGIQPADSALGTDRAVYIIGRGNDQPLYSCYLARGIESHEVYQLMRHRLLAP